MKTIRFFAVSILILMFLCGCTQATSKPPETCNVVLEEGLGFSCADHTQTIPRGGEATFYLQVTDGYEITAADRDNCTIQPSPNGGTILTVSEVRYSTVVSLSVRKSDAVVTYDKNDGSGERLLIPVTPSHLRWNTATGIFTREGYTLIGWNTKPDGSGISTGLGSRMDPNFGTTLYAQWSLWSDPSLFLWEQTPRGITITAYRGAESTITIPAILDGIQVTAIAADAFAGVDCQALILPDTIDQVEDHAFRDARIQNLWLFDNIRKITNPGCTIQTLHLNASELPVYSGTYYDTFQDKYDRLLSLKDRKKIVLFSGSSTRFGFDSSLLAEQFPEYEIINMGVFAYTNALPQLDLILKCMKPGDILIHMPEFDTSKRQFCTSSDLDEPFFNMMESNYDTITLLDLREYTSVFPALEGYLTTRDPMVKRSYRISAADFDEDGFPVASPSYNIYGDYVVYRPNSDSVLPIYGLPVHYTVAAFPEKLFIDSINRVYARFLEEGVTVYFTYSPRNALAISEESTPEARAQLDAYFREKLIVPVISRLEDSLWSGTYLYGTDNHLSTEGAAIHTQRLIPLIRAQLEAE